MVTGEAVKSGLLFEYLNHRRWREDEHGNVEPEDRGDLEIEFEPIAVHARTGFQRAHGFDTAEQTEDVHACLNETIQIQGFLHQFEEKGHVVEPRQTARSSFDEVRQSAEQQFAHMIRDVVLIMVGQREDRFTNLNVVTVRNRTGKGWTLSGRLETVAQFEERTELPDVSLQLAFRFFAFRRDAEENDLALVEIISKVVIQRIRELFEIEQAALAIALLIVHLFGRRRMHAGQFDFRSLPRVRLRCR